MTVQERLSPTFPTKWLKERAGSSISRIQDCKRENTLLRQSLFAMGQGPLRVLFDSRQRCCYRKRYRLYRWFIDKLNRTKRARCTLHVKRLGTKRIFCPKIRFVESEMDLQIRLLEIIYIFASFNSSEIHKHARSNDRFVERCTVFAVGSVRRISYRRYICSSDILSIIQR